MVRINITALAGTSLLVFAMAGCGDSQPPESVTPAAQDGGDVASAPPAVAAGLPRQPSPPGARVFFISPADGDTVSSPVDVEFGLEGMELVLAGDNQPNSGHHHLILNAGMPNMSLPIPTDENYIHFGDASSSTTLDLEPGEHTLTLLFGDYLHIPHDPPVASETITITVE